MFFISILLAALFVAAIHLYGNALSEALLDFYHLVSFEPVYLLYQAVRVEQGIHLFLDRGIYLTVLFVAFSILFLVLTFTVRFLGKRMIANG